MSMPGIVHAAHYANGNWHAGYWSKGFHRPDHFVSVTLCSSKDQAEDAAAEMNDALLRNESRYAPARFLIGNTRAIRGFYDDGVNQ
jgi:hypothetical protein